jgi:hypothetical protein
MDDPLTMVGSHVCATRTAKVCQWINGTISDNEAIMATYNLAVDLEEHTIIIQ